MVRTCATLLAFSLGAAAEAATLAIEAPYLREPPPGQSNAAIYFELRNTGQTAVVLSGARVDGARSASVHQHTHEGGMMRMGEAGPLTIAPGATLGFAPGGYHLMVFTLATRPRAGESLGFCLQYADGTEQCASARVKALGE